MNVRWILLSVVCLAALLGGVLSATAASPNTDQNGSAAIVQKSALIGATVLDSQGQTLGRIKDVSVDLKTGAVTFLVLDGKAPESSHPMTYSAARPIDNSMPAPSLPPCVISTDSGWTTDLDEFYNE